MPEDEPRLVHRMIELATRDGRDGYRRVTGLLHGAGWPVNHKRGERLWRRDGLKVPQTQPKRGRRWLADGSCVRRRPEYRHHVWASDFVAERTHDGRPLKILTVVDEYSRACLAIVVARRLRSTAVLETLADLFMTYDIPAHIRSACYEQVVKDLGAVGSSNRGTDTGSARLSRPIVRHPYSYRERRVPPDGRRAVSTRRAQDNGGHGLLSGWSRSLGFYGDRLVPHTWSPSERRAAMTANASAAVWSCSPRSLIGGNGRVNRCVRR